MIVNPTKSTPWQRLPWEIEVVEIVPSCKYLGVKCQVPFPELRPYRREVLKGVAETSTKILVRCRQTPIRDVDLCSFLLYLHQVHHTSVKIWTPKRPWLGRKHTILEKGHWSSDIRTKSWSLNGNLNTFALFTRPCSESPFVGEDGPCSESQFVVPNLAII